MSRVGGFFLCCAALIAGTAGRAAAQANAPVRLEHTRVARGDTVQINIDAGPETGGARIVFERAGERWEAESPAYTGAKDKPGLAAGGVPEGIPFGNYLVTVHVEARQYRPSGTLEIAPPGAVQPSLAEFSPASTYDIAEAYRPSTWKAVEQDLDHVKTPRLSANQRNQLRVERGARPLAIVWNGCTAPTAAGRQANPIALDQVSAKIGADHTVELCGVPRDARIWLGTEEIGERTPEPAPAWTRGDATGGDRYRVIRRLVLHGAGFQYDHPEDTAVWINGQRQAIAWTGCSDDANPGTQTAPRDAGIQGRIVSAEEAWLCFVSVPADGALRIATGYGDRKSEVRAYQVFSMGRTRVATIAGLIAMAAALLPLALLQIVRREYVISDQRFVLRQLFLDQSTDTYSLSKLQFYLWTVASMFTYAYLFISRVHVQHQAWPDVPGTLPGVIAVASGTAVGAQIVTTMNGTKGSGDETPSIADFITSGGVVATDRVQMLLWTLFAVGAFIYAVLQQGPGTIADLPALPQGLLLLTGLSSAGYLAGKMARKAGPVISEIWVTPQESDAALAKAAGAASVVVPDFTAALSSARTQLNALPAVASANATAAKNALSDAVKAAGAAHTTADINSLIADLVKLRATAETAAANAATDLGQNRATAAEAQSSQTAAAALQELAADVTQAISAAAASPIQSAVAVPPNKRIIEIRGAALSPDALLQIDHADLPFRMLTNANGQNTPEIVIRDDANPNMAKVLRLTIDPATLASADVQQLQAWFAADGHRLLSVTNPDGQKADASFDVPPKPPTQSPAPGAPTPGGTT